MAEKTIVEIKKIEQEISLTLQILRNELKSMTIIKAHVLKSTPKDSDAELIIRGELEESVSSLEELIYLHKNLEKNIDKLDYLLQDLVATKV